MPPAEPTTPRLALVTGGTGGIGTAVCRRLAAAGHRVVSTYLAQETELARTWKQDRAAEGFDIGLVECDVSSFESCTAMARRLEADFGTVEILVELRRDHPGQDPREDGAGAVGRRARHQSQ